MSAAHARLTLTFAAAAALVAMTGCQAADHADGPSGNTPASTGASASAVGKVAATGPAPSHAAATACALVTQQDASTALGRASGAGKATPSGSPDSSQCSYGDGALIVTVDDHGKTLYDTSRSAIAAAPAGTWSDVAGVGAAAFEAHGGPMASVSFYKNATFMSIILTGATTTVPSAAAIAVAKSAASRI